MFRRAIEICAVLALLGGVAAVPTTAGAAAPCPTAPLCFETDQNGTYELHVPPLFVVAIAYPEVAPLQDCYWKVVEADFGDGTKGTYEWDATTEFTGSHTFPAPGTYTVKIDATQGHHKSSGEPCPDFPVTATVVFPEPKQEGPGGPPPGEGGSGAGGVPTQPTVGAGSQLPDAFVKPALPASKPVAFWRRCGAGVRTHGVPCRRGRKVIDRAREKLAPRGSGTVAGFRCGLTSVAAVCRRGPDRVLGPPA